MATVVRVIEAAAALLAAVYVIGNLAALCVRWKQSRRWLPVLVVCGCLSAIEATAAGRVFFDDSEAGNTNLWNQDASRPKCTSVTTAADGLQGPFAGSRMIRCNDNGSTGVWETLAAPSFSMTNEVLYRYRVRPDSNHASTGGSTHKIGRVFINEAQYTDIFSMFATIGSGNGMYNDMILDGNRQGGSLYWGDASGDDTANPANWHTIMYYVNKSTGAAKVWHDGILVRNHTAGAISGELGENGNFYITSNWEDAHDATNYVYFDEVEIFTDAGTGGVGSMSDGTMTQGAGGGQEATPGVLALVASFFAPTVSASQTPQPPASSVILFLEWAPLVCGLLWHVRRAVVAATLACVGWTGATVILAAEEVKALTYHAAVTTIQAVGSLAEKVRR